jgi:hypothetical protein
LPEYVAHNAKLPFFQVIAPSPNKTNKPIPYHLITKKYKKGS